MRSGAGSAPAVGPLSPAPSPTAFCPACVTTTSLVARVVHGSRRQLRPGPATVHVHSGVEAAAAAMSLSSMSLPPLPHSTPTRRAGETGTTRRPSYLENAPTCQALASHACGHGSG